MQAVIMAGGKGTRLRPLTCTLPKPMVPVLNQPVMSYTVKLLKEHSLTNIAVTLAFLPDSIKNYFGDGNDWGVELTYFCENEPLGTAGSVKNIGALDQTLVVVSGDALTDVDLTQALTFHRERQAQVTLVLHRQPIPLEYGVVVTDDQDRITRFIEKPSWGQVFSDTVNTGIYILEPQVMEYCPSGEAYDFSKDLFPRLLADGVPMYGYVTDRYWCDIGDLASYSQAQFDALAGSVSLPQVARQQQGVWRELDSVVSRDAILRPPVYIGRGCQVGANAVLGPDAVLNDNCQVGADSLVVKSVVDKDCQLNQGCQLEGAVLGPRVSVGPGVQVLEDAVVGGATSLARDVVVAPGVKIWPEKEVAEATQIRHNLIWEQRAGQRMFGARDISGTLNGSITPELATQLGSALASLFESDIFVVTGDDTAAAALLVDALSVGIRACGCTSISELNLAAPITRFAVDQYKAGGAVHVRWEDDVVHLNFIDSEGASLDKNRQRKLEALVNAQDFRRVVADNLSWPRRERIGWDYQQHVGGSQRTIQHLNPPIIVGAQTELSAQWAKIMLQHAGYDIQVVPGGLEDIRAAVLASRGSWGGYVTGDGETLTLVSEAGDVIQGEDYRLLVVMMALERGGKKLVLTSNASQAAYQLAQGIEVIPAPSAAEEMLMVLRRHRDDVSVELQEILHFDALHGLVRVADYFAEQSQSLHWLMRELPVLHYQQVAVPCQWNDKGRVLRQLSAGQQSQDQEGVKIHQQKGWALILPDGDKPQVNIYAEGHSAEFAQELAAEVEARVEQLLAEEDS